MLGKFEQLVLATIEKIGPLSYAVDILMTIERHTGQTIDYCKLRSTLEQLEKKSFLISKMAAATNERGGKRKRLYTMLENT